jgi:phage terminase small subunit
VNTLPRPPKYLSAPARRLWRETTEAYELERHHLERHHLELLERACRALDTAIETEEILRQDGS